MKVIDLIKKTNAKELHLCWDSLYPSRNITLKSVEELLLNLKKIDIIKEDRQVKLIKEDYNDFYTAIVIEDLKEYSLTFIPWGIVLNMEILNEEMKDIVFLAYLLDELTFDGFTEEDMIKSRDDLIEIIENYEENPEDTYTLEELGGLFNSLSNKS